MKRTIVKFITIILLNISAILIILVGLIDPISIKQTVFTYSQGTEIPSTVSDYANGSEYTLSKASVDIQHVDNTQIGVYECVVVYRKKVYPFQIQIKDSEAPVAELIKVKWEIKVGDTLIASEMVTNVQETSSYQVYFDGEEPTLEKVFDTPGTYNDVYLFVEDQFGNQSERLRVSVSVGSDQIAPTLQGVDDIMIYQGSYFDPMSGVSASDNLDGDITSKVKANGKVDVTQLGTNRLVYTVSDEAGNITKVVRTVTVTNQYFNPSLVPDIGNGLFISKIDSSSRTNYFTTIRKSKLYMKNSSDQIDAMVNYFLENCVYVNKQQDEYSTSYSVIVERMGNSKGFASAFKYMCDQLEIPCWYVEGLDGSVQEAWNIVLYKGEYYHIDISTLFKKSDKIFYSDVEMEQRGYLFDKNIYPRCSTIYKEEGE